VHGPPAADGGKTLDGGRELHPLIRGVGLGAADDALGVAFEDERGPATRPRIAGAGAVGVERYSCQYRYRPQLSQTMSPVAARSSWIAWGRMLTRQPPHTAVADTAATATPPRALRMRS
jgi:hypothetical protein